MRKYSAAPLLLEKNEMTIQKIEILDGGIWNDARGALRYSNDLPVREFQRFYTIQNADEIHVRGWHGHRFEAKAFIALAGKIRVGLVEVDDWTNPSKELPVHTFDLDWHKPQVVLVPGGYANAILSLSQGAVAGVFSSSSLSESQADDVRFPSNYWLI